MIYEFQTLRNFSVLSFCSIGVPITDRRSWCCVGFWSGGCSNVL